MRPFDGRRVLLVVTGGIAAYKSAYLLRELVRAGARVDVLMTEAAERMVGRVTFEALSGRSVHDSLWTEPLAHIDLGRETDLIIVAPATADVLARLAGGFADDLASATLLAAEAPILAAPAMNTRMWHHPATRDNLERLAEWGVAFVGPEYGELAERETGEGRMSEPAEIMAHAGRMLETDGSLAGRKVVVTAGPTRAPLDPVRYVGNRSSGRMGYELAAAAWRRGADVSLISGPASLPAPTGPRLVRVERADEMLEALRAELENTDILLMAAAVADYRVASPSATKLKRGDGAQSVELEPEVDLLAETRELRSAAGVLTLGFALETSDGEANARAKLDSKGIDLIALNMAGEAGSGFDVSTNRITLIDARGDAEPWPQLDKRDVAERLLDRVEERLE